MRLIAILTAAAFLIPASVSISPAASGTATMQATDFSASTSKKKRVSRPKPKKGENLEAAPGTGPSGPQK